MNKEYVADCLCKMVYDNQNRPYDTCGPRQASVKSTSLPPWPPLPILSPFTFLFLSFFSSLTFFLLPFCLPLFFFFLPIPVPLPFSFPKSLARRSGEHSMFLQQGLEQRPSQN